MAKRFAFTLRYGPYTLTDAVLLTDAEAAAKSAADLKLLMRERFINWVSSLQGEGEPVRVSKTEAREMVKTATLTQRTVENG